MYQSYYEFEAVTLVQKGIFAPYLLTRTSPTNANVLYLTTHLLYSLETTASTAQTHGLFALRARSSDMVPSSTNCFSRFSSEISVNLPMCLSEPNVRIQNLLQESEAKSVFETPLSYWGQRPHLVKLPDLARSSFAFCLVIHATPPDAKSV